MNKKPKIKCANCGCTKFKKSGKKWHCMVTCVKCGTKRAPTFEEFYGNGTVD